MSKLLIIYAHPSRAGSHGYFLEKILELLGSFPSVSHELIDLYDVKYDPILKDNELYSAGRRAVSPENLAYQEKIKAASHLLFIYPTWWQNMPAILKGFMDRVFVAKFSFTYKAGLPIGLLKGKKAAAFSATGGPRLYTSLFTGDQSLSVLTKDILGFAGIQARGFSLGSARRLDDSDKAHLERIAKKVLKYLFN